MAYSLKVISRNVILLIITGALMCVYFGISIKPSTLSIPTHLLFDRVTKDSPSTTLQLPWFDHVMSLSSSSEPLLTLFTTFDVSDTFQEQIYTNTINMWPQLGANVRLILFVCGKINEQHYLIRRARTLKWTIEEVKCDDKLKLPFFKLMFLAAQRKYASTFYMYSNADMLYDRTLLGSLTAMKPVIREHVFAQNTYMLAVGARTMINVGQNRTINTLTELANITKNEGKFFTVAGVDYFISTKEPYPWNSFPNFVVSRVAFDSWTVNFFVRKKFPSFDLTATVVAAHQCDGRPVFRSKTLANTNYNLALMAKNFNWRDGMASCSQYKTRMSPNDTEFQVWERTKKGFCGEGTGVTMNQTNFLNMMKHEQEKLFQSVPV